MRLDHVSYAVGPDGLRRTAARLSKLLGSPFLDGGIHPRFGTRNMVLPMAGHQYLELVEVLDHPASDKAAFGQAVRARSAAGGGWLGWVVAVDDIAIVEKRLERKSVPGNRHRPDGVELRWRQVGLSGAQSDVELPFFVEWKSDPRLHPAAGADGSVTLHSLEIAGDPSRVADWLDASPNHVAEHVDINWVEPHGSPGLVAATFLTRAGPVRI